MHTIWFALPYSARQLCIDVQSIDDAQEVWDGLAVSFRMISARP